MKIEVNLTGVIVVREVYNIIQLRTQDDEFINICMRDSGFEFTYGNHNYEAKCGIVKKII